MAKNKRKPATGSIYFDYKDVKTLQRYINQFGQIEIRKRTSLTEMQQRRLARAIKRARHIGLLPFVTNNQLAGLRMAFGITNLKKGAIFQLDGHPYKVVAYSQKVMGRGGSIVNVRIKSLIDGKVLDKTFKGNEAVEPAEVTNQNVQYLYNDGKRYYFMDNETYEQIDIDADLLGENAGYLKEGDVVKAQKFKDQVINIELPKNVFLKVVYTESVVKGDTTSSVLKNAQLETGITIKVPAFIKQGDVISVSTEDGSYRERQKQGLGNGIWLLG